MNRFRFIGLNFHPFTLAQSINKLEEFIRDKSPHMSFTPTAELIVRANEDAELREIYNNTDLLTIDSYVVYYAARLFGKPVTEPVSAARLMFSFLETCNEKGYGIYLLGAKEEVVNKVEENLKKQYQNIKISGKHNGYFDFNNDGEIVRVIKNSKADVLFVAMSSPLKENFISKNLKEMNVPVCLGVGGSFDIIAGKCKLAPRFISVMGLEWLYRLIQEPRRMWKRYLITNTKFLILLIKELFKKEG